jgi:hypothetical protein
VFILCLRQVRDNKLAVRKKTFNLDMFAYHFPSMTRQCRRASMMRLGLEGSLQTSSRTRP